MYELLIFLNGDLEEEVYMQIPLRIENKDNVNEVCKLKKSLYGLKQSLRVWFDRLTRVIKKLGYIQGQSDQTLFIIHSSESKITFLIVYVEDIILS